MKAQMPDWVFNQMIDGLQKLLILRLQGSPPADTVQAVAQVWCEALTPYTASYTHERDEHRLPIAFKLLIREAERWVQPAQLIKLIPPRTEQDAVGLLEEKKAPLTEEQKQQVAKNIAEIKQHLNKLVDKISLTPPPAKTSDELLYEYSLIYDPATGKKRDQPLPDKRKKKS